MLNVLVINLSRRVTDDHLKWLFGDCGIVNNVNIWVDHDDHSLRFAIVQMRHSADAKWAIKTLNGKRFGGRVLWVERAPKGFGVLRTLCAEASKKRNMRRPLGCDLPRLS